MKQLIACLFVFALVVCSQHVAYSSPDNDVGVQKEYVTQMETVDQYNYILFEKSPEYSYLDFPEENYFCELEGCKIKATNPTNPELHIESWCKEQSLNSYINTYNSPVIIKDEPDMATVTSLFSCGQKNV